MSLGLKYKNNEQIFAERQRGGVPYLSYPLLENTGIVNHGFSTRLGGVSTGCFSSMNISLTRGDDPEAVKKNRELIAQAIGVEVADFTYTQQTHTTNVKRVYARERGQSFPETDGMITDVPGDKDGKQEEIEVPEGMEDNLDSPSSFRILSFNFSCILSRK